jgi:hypothetical protein
MEDTRTMTIYELTILSYRLPSLRRLILGALYSRNVECVYTHRAMMSLPRHEIIPGLFGRN